MSIYSNETEKPFLDRKIGEKMNHDPLAELESNTGESYKDLPVFYSLGSILASNQKKEDTLSFANDTYFQQNIYNYIEVVKKCGFESVLEVPFQHPRKDGTINEKLYIFFKPDEGILLEFDSFAQYSVNGGNVYFNWMPKKQYAKNGLKYLFEVGCSTKASVYDKNFYKDEDNSSIVFVSSLDCREGLRYKLRKLRTYGVFITPWVEQHTPLWLTHHKDKDIEPKANLHERIDIYEKKTKERGAMLPRHVQICTMLPNSEKKIGEPLTFEQVSL